MISQKVPSQTLYMTGCITAVMLVKSATLVIEILHTILCYHGDVSHLGQLAVVEILNRTKTPGLPVTSQGRAIIRSNEVNEAHPYLRRRPCLHYLSNPPPPNRILCLAYRHETELVSNPKSSMMRGLRSRSCTCTSIRSLRCTTAMSRILVSFMMSLAKSVLSSWW